MASPSRRSTSTTPTSPSISRTSNSKLGPRTKLVAVGYASNAVGSVNPVREIIARAHEVGALTFIDAVAFAPHGPIDVVDLDTDFLACSAYKWFGPHVGVLYGKADILESLPAYKVRPAHDRFETGTPNYEGIAGTLAATDYLRDVGRSYGDVAGAPGRRQRQRAQARAGRRDGRHRRLRARAGHPLHRRPRGDQGSDHPRHHRPVAVHDAGADGRGDDRRASTRARPRRRSGGAGSTPGTATSTRPA